jgi:hypothetical protein
LGNTVIGSEARQDARAKRVQCPYCLGEFPDAEMTHDHVIARSWFPAKTPPIAKWKVRCCRACNNDKSALERDVLGRLALCLDPDDPSLRDLIEKARRSMDPGSAKTARDIGHRINRRQAIFHSLVDIHSPDEPGVLPYFTGNFAAGSRLGVLIDSQALDELVKMWVRGIHMREVDSIIPTDYEISVEHRDDETRAKAFSNVIGHGRVVQKGPGVEVTIYYAEEPGAFAAVYAFSIWNTLRCVGFVMPVD